MRIGIAFGALALVAGLAAVSCSTAPAGSRQSLASSGGRCFLASQVRGFRAVDDDSVLVFVGASRAYELNILPTCPNIDWSQTIGIRSTGGSSFVCSGLDAELFVPSGVGLNRCPVLAIRQLTPEQARAARRQATR